KGAPAKETPADKNASYTMTPVDLAKAKAFKRSFNEKKNAVLAKLPAKKYSEIKSSFNQSLIRFNQQTSRNPVRVTLISWLDGFDYAVRTPRSFCSERFSKNG